MVKGFIVTLCLFMVLVVGIPTRAYANEPVEISIPVEPFWTHTTSISASLSITNGRALMAGTVIGQPGTERISVNARLERVNPNGTRTHIASWNNLNATGNIWSWERPHFVARGHNYRLTLTATVFRHGTSEIVSVSRGAWAS